MMIFKDKIILITGANGGIGKCLLRELLDRGAAKIYAADLNIEGAQLTDRVFPVKLDVTKQEDILACVQACGDIDILVNNAGVELASPVCSQVPFKAGVEVNVNYLGVQNLSVAFWEILKAKESAAIVNMLSIASFVIIPKIATYCASKAGAHSITRAFRHEAIDTNIKVIGIYPGYVDTAMTKDIDVEKVTPEELAVNICLGLESGQIDIFPDKMSREIYITHWHETQILN